MNESSSTAGRNRGEAARAIWVLVITTTLLYLFLAGIGAAGYIANHNRINDIQASRIHSCEQTYKAFRQVFAPVIPPPAQRTPKVRHNLHVFDATIHRLVNQCDEQTSSDQ